MTFVHPFVVPDAFSLSPLLRIVSDDDDVVGLLLTWTRVMDVTSEVPASAEGPAAPVAPAAGAVVPPPALAQQMDLLSRQVEACRESLAGEYARVQAMGAATDDTQRDRFARLEQRLSGLEGLLQRNGEQIGHQLGDLRERMAAGSSTNQSDFGDLATGPVPLLAGAGSADDLRRLRDLVLNLSDLKADLRLEQRQLRQRLRDLPDAGAAAGSQSRPRPPRAA